MLIYRARRARSRRRRRYRFNGHSPADPEHERGRKSEKRWARAECDPLKIFEDAGILDQVESQSKAGILDQAGTLDGASVSVSMAWEPD